MIGSDEDPMIAALRHHEVALDRVFDGTTDSLAASRNAVAGAAADLGFDADTVERLKLVTSELTTNAVENSPGERYRTLLWRSGDVAIVSIWNRTTAADIPPRDHWGPDVVDAGRGRGLAIVEAVAERVEVRPRQDGWVEVRAALAGEDSAPSSR